MGLLLLFALKSLLLAVVALGLLRLLRRSCAAARSVVAHLMLLALVLMPVANLLLPPLQIAVDELADAPALPSLLEGPITALSSTAVKPVAIGEIDTGQVTSAGDWAALAYALPTIALLLITLMAIGRLFLLRARASVLADRIWLTALGHAQRLMGVKHTTLLVGDELPSPVSWGLVRPVILLDRETLRRHDQAAAIIAHELAHIARFDWAKLLFARIATALYWFNPLVWILAREAHQLREEAADDAVLAANITDTDYAQLLLRTAAHQSQGRLLTAHGVAPSRHSLARRIGRVLDANTARGPVTPRFSFAVVLGVLALAAPLAVLTFEASGGARDDVESLSLPAKVMRTVEIAAERSTDLIRSAIEAPIEAERPMQAVDVEAGGAMVVAESGAMATPQPGSVAPSEEAPTVIQEEPKVAAVHAAVALPAIISVPAVVEPVLQETMVPLYGRDSFRNAVPVSDYVVFLQARSGQWYQANLGKRCRGLAQALSPRESSIYNGQAPGALVAASIIMPSPGGGTLSVGSNRSDGNFGRFSVVRVEDSFGPISCEVESLAEGTPPPGKTRDKRLTRSNQDQAGA